MPFLRHRYPFASALQKKVTNGLVSRDIRDDGFRKVLYNPAAAVTVWMEGMSEMKNLDRWFILMAITYALLGMLLGLWMGANEDMTHLPVHTHLNLVGWTSMALFGLIYKAYPSLMASPLARWHFILMAIGTPVMLIGIPIAHSGGTPLLAIAGSVTVIAAFAKFLANFAKNGR